MNIFGENSSKSVNQINDNIKSQNRSSTYPAEISQTSTHLAEKSTI
jgi:hypothetical protein